MFEKPRLKLLGPRGRQRVRKGPDSGVRIKVPGNKARERNRNVKLKQAVKTMSPMRNMMVKVKNPKREIQGRNIDAHKEVKLINGSKGKQKGQRGAPINHDMGAMIECHIWWRRNEKGPGQVSECLVAWDTGRVRVRIKGGGDCPQGFLNKDTICCG